ncbi:MAG: pantoate--beta-alanine ligase [Elusimicrobiota bacterium]
MKTKSTSELRKIVAALKRKNKRIVFTNGCFDILHAGHVRLIKKAKSLGDVLIVGLNSDASIRRIKGGGRPVIPERERAEVLVGLSDVDYITVFNEDTPYSVIKALKPDVLVKGSDWSGREIVGRGIVGRVVRFPLAGGWSTSGIIKKCKKIRITG